MSHSIGDRRAAVTLTEHGELACIDSILHEILWEKNLDWGIERPCDSHHHVGAKHPKDVVEEEAAEQDAPNRKRWQRKHGNAVDRKREAVPVKGCDESSI